MIRSAVPAMILLAALALMPRSSEADAAAPLEEVVVTSVVLSQGNCPGMADVVEAALGANGSLFYVGRSSTPNHRFARSSSVRPRVTFGRASVAGTPTFSLRLRTAEFTTCSTPSGNSMGSPVSLTRRDSWPGSLIPRMRRVVPS